MDHELDALGTITAVIHRPDRTPFSYMPRGAVLGPKVMDVIRKGVPPGQSQDQEYPGCF